MGGTYLNADKNSDPAVVIRIPHLKGPDGARHALGDSITHFAERISDIGWASAACVPHAQNLQIRLIRKIARQRRELIKLIETADGSRQAEAVARLIESSRITDSIIKSEMPQTVVKGLFIELFCEFDQFIGNLIRSISALDESKFYHLKREISIGELKSLGTIDDLRDDLLEKEIESLRRDSYSKQFQYFEKEYDLTLTKFEEWPHFVEASQRRNLFTHAGGVVSDQYRQVCKGAGMLAAELPAVGTQLTLNSTYFYQCCQIVERTGLMLGYTLWRKVFPQDAEQLDRHLNDLIYHFLMVETFDTALRLSDFGLSQPFCKQTSNANRRVRLMNRAIALQRLGRRDESLRQLESEDWSDTLRDFRLALAVLKGDYSEAADLMLKIGREGELVSESGYRSWPLFWEFRKSPEFLESYKTIFGYSFTETVVKDAREADPGLAEPSSRAKSGKTARKLPSPKRAQLPAKAASGLKAA